MPSYFEKKPNKISHQDKQKQSKAKKDLKELFKPKKNPTQSKDWQTLEQSRGKQFQTLALQYIDTHGMPKVWDDLLSLLNLEDLTTLNMVLDKLEELLELQNNAAKTLACARLRLAKLNHEDPDVQQRISTLIEHLTI